MTMNTTITKFLLPLAALAMGSVACDPFPEKPGGDPAIVRVITYGGAGGASNTVETVTGGNTVSTDFAQPDDVIRIQFNKPMDGSTVQAYTNYDSTIPIDPDTIGIRNDPGSNIPVPPRPPSTDPGIPYDNCTPASNLVLTGFETTPGIPLEISAVSGNVIPGTGVYPVKTLTCYDPASATDGGSIVVTPGAPLKYGTTYSIDGTVKDYEGKSLTIHVTVTVDQRPIPFGVDGYTTGVDWFDSGADSYEVLWAPDVSGAPGTFTSLAVVNPAVDCDGVLCEVLHHELVPHTDYWYQVTETTGATTITRPAAQGPASTLGALTPTLGVATTTTPPPTIIPGLIRVAWGSTQGANGYDVEVDDGITGWVLYSHHTAASRVVYLGTPAPGTTVPTAPGTLTSGTTYSVRVTPTFASGFVAEKGNVASKAAP
jgi:hypothetical protein